jgi:hypothetical protein
VGMRLFPACHIPSVSWICSWLLSTCRLMDTCYLPLDALNKNGNGVTSEKNIFKSLEWSLFSKMLF